ncbi:hypothetical protein FLM48_20000 [Shewanella sp. Scap07]|uniref:hypothetical protein n=1 Tax=Shewanella sp. Scap07 TaxID=2589987 RepID=UPI0015B98FA5|nr:hypothetical protein [Shewanella sp. Scap07]QLE87155.1 hypothetical protein FLM48_20000 [Shewanella sp. Scap07]
MSKEITWKQATSFWWSFFWRATLFSVIGGVLIGFVLGLVFALTGSDDNLELISSIVGYVIAIPISICCMYSVLHKSFNGYSLRFVKDSNELGL